MIKKAYKILKKIIFSCLLLYGYNVLAEPLKIIIPINLYTVGYTTLLGVPALFSMIIIYLVTYF
ncbi:MAG: pro-sigmaK processing inhibitor BofA family protein [Bacilli bacterium]|nr:pro-sigmaK processing inhibitor BofA family protein [Bacilli bacterium]